ncbi:MAG: imidazole glycerol phosphate synthase subunit HisH [Flavobacteriaceae bacterium]|nr:imidazole glycerol phosphate synthase subunit HisH [Flavobacteriaceae bacterium]
MNIVIIDYGAGNVKSLEFAINRLGYQALVSDNAEVISKADKVIFPGVGEASSAMRKLKSTGLDTLIPELKQPVLGICLGMQLMCSFSKENDTIGLGIFDEKVSKFSSRVKIPQIGWNKITQLKSALFEGIEEGTFVYMVHSYYVPLCVETIATSEYDILYSAALQKDNFFGVQFHPEKSSKSGSQILKNFLEL